MKKTTCFLLGSGLLIALSVGWLTGQQPGDKNKKTERPKGSVVDQSAGKSAENAEDVAAIKKSGQSFLKAFKDSDAKAVANHWTENGEYFADDGTTFRGRAAIEKAYTELFDKKKIPTEAEVEVTSIRFPSKNTAIEEGYFKVRRGNEPPATSKYSVLHVREDGKWQMAFVREWPREGTTLRDLDWLIGSWVTKRGENEILATYEWWGDKGFIRVDITLKQKDRTVKGFQMIGRDASTGQLRSWTFDPEGNFGEANWSRDGKKWMQESASVHTDGSIMTGTNIMTPIDRDSFTFQTVQRSEDGQQVADILPVLVTRVKSTTLQKAPKNADRDSKVREAIDKGMAFLRKQIPAGAGGHPGAKALLGLTLLECGAARDDEDVKKVADMVRKDVAGMTNPYNIAPTIFFLDRLYKDDTPTPQDKKLIRTLALRLVAGQRRPMYLWRYSVPALTGPQEEELVVAIKEKTHQGPLVNDQDMSCSHLAALGLWIARRHGVPGVDEALRKAAVTARSVQDIKNGTWNYGASGHGGQFEDTATCCGLILISLGQAVEKQPGPFMQDIAVKNALKHLEGVIKANANPKKLTIKAHGNFYFLWALERTCLILNQEHIGESKQDWHRWGTKIALAQQQPDGHWDAGTGAVPDTCFALLFLLRANLFKDLSERLGTR